MYRHPLCEKSVLSRIVVANSHEYGVAQGLAGFLDRRIVTEKTLWAMPECAIGLVPDVGFACMASGCMSLELALFLAMTGTRLRTPADLLYSGIGTDYVPSSEITRLKQDLQCTDFAPTSYIARSQVDGAFMCTYTCVMPLIGSNNVDARCVNALCADLLKSYVVSPMSEDAEVMPKMNMISKHFSTAARCMDATGSAVQAVQTLYKSLREEVQSCISAHEIY